MMMIFRSILLVVAVIVTGVNCFATKRSFQQERRATIHYSAAAVASTISQEEAPTVVVVVDRRPHEQRVDTPRQARRLNHPFQHLYRHTDPRFDDNEWTDRDTSSTTSSSQHYPKKISDFYWNKIMTESNSTFAQQPIDVETSLSAIYYLHLHGGYSLDEIHHLHKSFPPLLEIDVIRHLRPKMRFLKDCLDGCIVSSYPNSQSSVQTLDPKLKAALPGSFYGSRYERTIAPRHAFLIHLGLPSGKILWDSGSDNNESSLLEQFLLMHRKPKQFAAMCNDWRRKYGATNIDNNLPITSEQVVAFDKLFQRGILSAARDDSNYVYSDGPKRDDNSPSLLSTANVTSAQLVTYLIQHGANAYETDVRGASLFHWAAGCGNLDALKALVVCCNTRNGISSNSNSTLSTPGTSAALLWKASRDDAIPLHWAAAGAGPKEFGIGGSVDVCNYLLSICNDEQSIVTQRKLINAQTKDGNTVLMWSAWSGSLEIVKLLIRNRAETGVSNRNGCVVAHWAASGGNLDVCKYLAGVANVNFDVENYARNTPLSHAVAYGRTSVAKWLREVMLVDDVSNNAQNLALDFVNWGESGLGLISEEEQAERKKISELFTDWAEEMGQ
jgi:ankyrin repeat protein